MSCFKLLKPNGAFLSRAHALQLDEPPLFHATGYVQPKHKSNRDRLEYEQEMIQEHGPAWPGLHIRTDLVDDVSVDEDLCVQGFRCSAPMYLTMHNRGTVWIRTPHAWYILGNPADDYRPFFANDGTSTPPPGRVVSETPPRKRGRPSNKSPRKRRRLFDKETPISSPSPPPLHVVTPRVGKLVSEFFPGAPYSRLAGYSRGNLYVLGSFTIVGDAHATPTPVPPPSKEYRQLTEASIAKVDEADIIDRGKVWFEGHEVTVPLYARVDVDGVYYAQGDYVALQPGDDDDKARKQLHALTEQLNPWANGWYGVAP